MKASDSRDEALSIGDRKVDCRVIEYALEIPEVPRTAKLTLWRAKDESVRTGYRELGAMGPNLLLAPDVVRAEYQVEEKKRSAKYTLQVVSLGEKVTVGKKQISCAVETVEMDRSDGIDTGAIKRWLSPEVPGHIVKMQVTLGKAGKEGTGESAVTDFEAKPRQ
jgi:hypothetical protein